MDNNKDGRSTGVLPTVPDYSPTNPPPTFYPTARVPEDVALQTPNEALIVPESADSASIVSRLHQYDGHGDDRKNRHARGKYIKELIGSQSQQIVQEAASHFMSVGEDGKIKESASVKALRDGLVKERGVELTKGGLDKSAAVAEQVALYKNMLMTAAKDLPDDLKDHYLKKRLTANVAAKRRTLEGRNKRKVAEAPPAVEIIRPAKMGLEEAAAHAVIDRNGRRRGGIYVNPADPEDVAGQQNMVSAQRERDLESRRVQELANLETRRQAEASHTQALTDAADAAVSNRQNNPNYVNPADPEDRSGQEAVRGIRLEEQGLAQEARDRVAREAADARVSATPLPSEQTDAYFAEIRRRAAVQNLDDATAEAKMAKVRQLHRTGMSESTKATLQAEFDAGKTASDEARQRDIANYQKPEKTVQEKVLVERYRAMTDELNRIADGKEKDEKSARGRISGWARRNGLAILTVPPLITAATVGVAYDVAHWNDSNANTSSEDPKPFAVQLDTSKMPSEQALEDSGVQIVDDTISQAGSGDTLINGDVRIDSAGDVSNPIGGLSSPIGSGSTLTSADVSESGEPISAGSSVENKGGVVMVGTEEVIVQPGGSWGEILSGVNVDAADSDVVRAQKSQQISEWLNNPNNLDKIEAAVLSNLPNGMTVMDVRDQFDAIRDGAPQEDGWHDLDSVDVGPINVPTAQGVQTMHDNREGVYAELLGHYADGKVEVAAGGDQVIGGSVSSESVSGDNTQVNPASSTSGASSISPTRTNQSFGSRIRGFFGGKNGQ